MSYNKDTDEVYAGGIGILEKWVFSGSEVIHSYYTVYRVIVALSFHPVFFALLHLQTISFHLEFAQIDRYSF